MVSVDSRLSPQIESQQSLQGTPKGTLKLDSPYYYSNEPFLYKFFPFTGLAKGVIFGVGSDQVLDLAANSQAKMAVLLDCTEPTVLFMRTLLETGIDYKRRKGVFPTTDQFIECFKPSNLAYINQLMDRLYGGLESQAGIQQACNLLYRSIKVVSAEEKATYDWPYWRFMQYRVGLMMDLDQPYAWYSTDEKLHRILDMYGDNRLILIHGDLCDNELISEVGALVSGQGLSVGVVYLSNVEEKVHHFSVYGSIWRLWHNLHQLPLKPESVILRTSDSFLKLPKTGLPPTRPFSCCRWHYNMEEFGHHQFMDEHKRCYHAHRWADTVNPLDGFSILSLDKP